MCNDKQKIWFSANEIRLFHPDFCRRKPVPAWVMGNNVDRQLLIHWNQCVCVMENNHKTDAAGNVQPEDNYAAHQDNPAPSPEAVKERNDRPASITLWIVITLAIIIAAIFYLIYVL